MKSPWHSAREVTRLEALRRYELQDPSPDHPLDDLTTQKVSVCATSVFLPLADASGFARQRLAQGSVGPKP
jgi:hypothetical protein